MGQQTKNTPAVPRQDSSRRPCSTPLLTLVATKESETLSTLVGSERANEVLSCDVSAVTMATEGELAVALPSTTTKQGQQSESEEEEAEEYGCCNSPVKKAHRNVYGISISFSILFCAFQGLQNLQSSINADGGLGLVSLSILYASFMISAFVTPGIVKTLGSKYALMAGMFSHLIYIASNYYPSWYTLVPTSILVGFWSGPVWAATSVHITQIAIEVAPVMKEQQEVLISRFTGVMYLFFQLSALPGNFASSLILFFNDKAESNHLKNGTDNVTADDVCQSLDVDSIHQLYLYILISVYIVFDIVAIVSLALIVDRLSTDKQFFSTRRKFRLFFTEPFVLTLKVLFDWKMLLLAPMGVLSGLEMSFAFSTFTEVYISECLGVSRVGFALMVLGLSSAVMSGVVGRIVKCVPRFLITILAGCINAGLVIFLLLWKRMPSYALVFTFAVGWGCADAIWNTIYSSFVGILFPTKAEPAYSVARLWLAVGFTVGFATAEFTSLLVRLYILLGAVVVTVILYLVVEFRTQSKAQIFPCLYCLQKPAVEEEAQKNEEQEQGGEHPGITGSPSVKPSSSYTNALCVVYKDGSMEHSRRMSVVNRSPSYIDAIYSVRIQRI